MNLNKEIICEEKNITLHLELRGRYSPTYLSGQCKGEESNTKVVVGVLLEQQWQKERLFPIIGLRAQFPGGKLE